MSMVNNTWHNLSADDGIILFTLQIYFKILTSQSLFFVTIFDKYFNRQPPSVFIVFSYDQVN